MCPWCKHVPERHMDMDEFLGPTKPATAQLFRFDSLLSSNELHWVICIYWQIGGLYNHLGWVKRSLIVPDSLLQTRRWSLRGSSQGPWRCSTQTWILGRCRLGPAGWSQCQPWHWTSPECRSPRPAAAETGTHAKCDQVVDWKNVYTWVCSHCSTSLRAVKSRILNLRLNFYMS